MLPKILVDASTYIYKFCNALVCRLDSLIHNIFQKSIFSSLFDRFTLLSETTHHLLLKDSEKYLKILQNVITAFCLELIRVHKDIENETLQLRSASWYPDS